MSDNIKQIIKDEIKNNLKVNTLIQFPHAFSDGYILTELLYGNEVISANKYIIKTGSTFFSL